MILKETKFINHKCLHVRVLARLEGRGGVDPASPCGVLEFKSLVKDITPSI